MWYTVRMTLSTSQDWFFLVLAAAVGVLTILFAWLLVYVIAIVRRANEVTRRVTDGITKIEGILDAIREAMHNSSSHLSFLVSAIREVAGFAMRRKERANDEEDESPAPKRGKK